MPMSIADWLNFHFRLTFEVVIAPLSRPVYSYPTQAELMGYDVLFARRQLNPGGA